MTKVQLVTLGLLPPEQVEPIAGQGLAALQPNHDVAALLQQTLGGTHLADFSGLVPQQSVNDSRLMNDNQVDPSTLQTDQMDLNPQ